MHSTASVFVYGDCMTVIDFIHLSAMGVASIAKSTFLRGVYIHLYSVYHLFERKCMGLSWLNHEMIFSETNWNGVIRVEMTGGCSRRVDYPPLSHAASSIPEDRAVRRRFHLA